MQPRQRVACSDNSSTSCAQPSAIGRAALHSWGGPSCTSGRVLARCRALLNRQQQVAAADTGQPQLPQHEHEQLAATFSRQQLAQAYQQQARLLQQQQQQQQTQLHAPPPRPRSPPPRALRRTLVPVRRAVRTGERRLGADVATVAVTVAFVTATIVYDRGVEDLLDNIFSDSPTGSVACILFGLGLVIGVRLIAGAKMIRGYFSLGGD